MRRDTPYTGIDRKGDLDLLVDRGFITARAEAAMIVIVAQRFQRAVGAEHTAATGAQYVPGKVEQPEPGSMEKAGDHPLFVEPGPLGKIQHIDAVEFVVRAAFDQLPDSIGHRRIGGLFQDSKLGLGVAHTET